MSQHQLNRMNYFQDNHEIRDLQSPASQTRQVDDTCHIESDSESGVLFDIEVVWCSFCQKPRFEDGVCTDICICVSFATINDGWLPQVVDNRAFEIQTQNQSLLTRHYDAVDTWLQGSVDDDVGQISPTTPFDAMIGISPVATRLGLYTLSREDGLSPSTDITCITGGISATSTGSTRSTTPSCELSNLEVDSSDGSEFRRMLNAKQRRREQNRNSQHRFRERKNQVTKDLQDKVDSLTRINDILTREILALRKQVGNTEREIV